MSMNGRWGNWGDGGSRLKDNHSLTFPRKSGQVRGKNTQITRKGDFIEQEERSGSLATDRTQITRIEVFRGNSRSQMADSRGPVAPRLFSTG